MFWLLLTLAVLCYLVIRSYNTLQGLVHQVQRFKGDINAALQKKIDLTNKVMDIAKEYGDHEKLTHLTVASDFSSANKEADIALTRLNGLAMHFPELRASENYKLLMSQLHDIEKDIEISRNRYNEVVGIYNGYRGKIPQVFFASTLGFDIAPYYSIENNREINDFKTDDGERLKEVFAASLNKTSTTLKKGTEELTNKLHKENSEE